MSQAYNPNSIDLELQVRLMNLVMGEASDFERDQLQLLMEQRPELAAYYQHLEHLHGLLCVVGAGETSMGLESSNSAEVWQLPPDRRQQLLAVLDGKELRANPKVVLASTASKKWLSIRTRWLAVGVATAAACLVVSFRLQSSHRMAASIIGGTARSYKTVQGLPNIAASIPESTPSFLSDDVQYFPNKMPEPSTTSSSASSDRPNVALQGAMGPGLAKSEQGSGGEGRPSAASSQQNNNDKSLYYWQAQNAKRTQASDTPARMGGMGGMSGMPSGMGGPTVGAPGNNGPGGGGGYGGGGYGGSGGGFGGGAAGSEREQSGYGTLDAAGVANAPTSQLGTVVNGQEDLFGNNLGKQLTSNPDSDGNRYHFGSDYEVAAQAGQAVASDTVPSDLTRDRLSDFSSYNLSSAVELPGIVASNENNLNQEVATIVSVPDSGTILLGGIKRLREGQTENGTPILSKDPYLNRLFNNNAIGRETNTLMMTVTPRFIIPEEEEEALGQFPRAKESSIAEKSNSDVMLTELQKKDSKADLEKDSLDAIVLQQNTEDSERRIKTLSGKDLNRDTNGREVSLGLNSAPAPSPEVAAGDRFGIKAAGKPAGPQQPVTLDEQSAATEAFSTFSLHVSDVSFKLAQAALNQGQWPDATKIRIEEFVNAMDYHDPLPSGNQKVACRVDQAIHPFLMQRNLLRVSMRTAATGRSQNTPLRLTILLDNSGSMERSDRRQSVLRAFQSLSQQLSANDQVTLISFASTPRLLADKVPGNEGAKLMQLIETLPSEGGTNIEAALMLAREKAAEQQLAGAQNRIVMLTDGAVNLGDANPDSLAKLVTQMRDSGIAFDAAGISAQNLNDEVLEALTRQGDGRYYLIDSAASAGETFANQIAGALRPSAQNVKVQVEFNPKRVGRYKLLGFEKHRLNKEDFRNDKVDAAEMAAAEAGVAVYQYEIKPNGTGDVGSVSVRFRDMSTGEMVERRWPIVYESSTPRLEQSQASMQLATCAAMFAAKLGGGALADSVDLGQLQKILTKLPEPFASQLRVQELRAMIDQALAIR